MTAEARLNERFSQGATPSPTMASPTTAVTSADAGSGSLLRRRGRKDDFTGGTYTLWDTIGKERGRRYRRCMQLDVVSTDAAPKAIGPYSQAVSMSAERLVFCSGQIPLDPRTGELVGAGDIRLETHQVLKNIDAVLRASGASLATVVKTTVYLVNLGDFAGMNEVYATYFTGTPPARATIQVAALPRGAQVEIDAVAAVP